MQMGSYSRESLFDLLITAVDLVHMVDDAGAMGGKGSDQQGYPGAYIGRCHFDAAQGMFAFQSDHRGPVWVAQNDLGTHVNEFIHKKQAAFEHFLVNEY